MDLILDNLKNLCRDAPCSNITDEDKIVIFSDLHVGNGSERDDFKPNAGMWFEIALDWYLDKKFKLILNGDIEELQRFHINSVMTYWTSFYHVLNAFKSRSGLIKIIGNHDHELLLRRDYPYFDHLANAVKFVYRKQPILVFHGHQANVLYEKYNDLAGFVLRYFIHPLRIKNRPVASDRKKQFKVEKKVYEFSSRNKLISIIGHTHRPLFESLSRADFLKFQIEALCRVYPSCEAFEQKRIEEEISYFKDELQKNNENSNGERLLSSLYNNDVLIPCMFNSGCVIGKRGMTAIEIANGEISLVHWFDSDRSKKYLTHYEQYHPQKMPGTNYYRVEMKKDSLEYVSTRIKLLA